MRARLTFMFDGRKCPHNPVGRAERPETAAPHLAAGRKVPVDGGTIQLLEAHGFAGPADSHLHGGDHCTKSVDGANSQPNAGDSAGRSVDTWLDPRISDPPLLSELLRAPSEEFLDCYPVSKLINSGRVDTPECSVPQDVDYHTK